MDTEEWVRALCGDSLRDARQRFGDLTCPQAESVKDDWRARFVGPSWLRALSPAQLSLLGFGGWWGKRLGAVNQPAGCTNLFGRDGDRTRFPMTLREGSSQLDGRPVLRLTYPEDARWPWRHATDELRALDEGHLMGMGVIDVPIARGQPFPFLLVRSG